MQAMDSTQIISEGSADVVSAAPVVTQSDILVTDVTKTFGVTRALDRVSFSANLGEIHAIVGGNGCGKSTLSKVISGVLPVDSGHVSILGHTPSTPREARQAGIATVFQEVLVADECSVLDNLYVGSDGLWTKSQPAIEKYRTAEKIMHDLTALDIDPESLVGSLPLSIKQWITIGRALLCKPKVLILDESSAALDFDSTERLFKKMRELRDEGSAIIIVTHRIAELIRISDRATVMRDGRDVGVLAKGEVTEKNLLSLMTGKASSSTVETGAQQAAEEAETVMRLRDIKIWPESEPIDFELVRGEIVGVAGLDGQGQNEFTRILAGVQTAEEGLPEVLSRGEEPEKIRDLVDADRCKVAYVSGDRKREGIFANLSILENMLIALYPKTLKIDFLKIIDWGSLSSIFDWGIEKLSIKIGYKSDKITSLSGGNQQKVLIARALALRPRILVLNDPARGIDVEAKRELYVRLREFASLGNSVVFMSSELEEFIGLCPRVIVFREGAIFDEFTGEGVEPVRIFEAMFGHTTGLAGKHQGQEQGAEDDDSRADAMPKLKLVEAPKTKPRPPKDLRIIDFDAKAADPVVNNEIAPDEIVHDKPSTVTPRKMKIVYSDE